MIDQLQIDEIKQAAGQREREILSRLGGIPEQCLDGKPKHPCPKCGGKDRFRSFNDGTGGVICNQCFREGNGDVIASLRWLHGWSFPEAVSQLRIGR